MNFFTELFSLILPVQCIKCSVDGKIICLSCKKILEDKLRTPPNFIFGYGSSPKIAAHLPYGDVISRIILGAKDDGSQELQSIVVNSLVLARSLFPPKLLLVPIPSHANAKRKRGRDFNLDIARAVSRITGDQVASWLKFVRNCAPQKNLNARERRENMAGALSLSDKARAYISEAELDIHTLVLDDVLTTGATMRAGIRALIAGGAPCLGGISAAYSLNWSASQPPH